MTKLFFTILLFSFLAVPTALGQTEPLTEINFFFSPTCPHCAQEQEFLDGLQNKYPEIKIAKHNAFEKQGSDLLKQFYQDYNVAQKDKGWVPITFTEKRYFIGFNEQIGRQIEGCVLECQTGQTIEDPQASAVPIDLRETISLPIIGKVNLSNLSPIGLAVILGGLDGFNACAMIALGFLLAVLIATGARRRLIIIGGVFILVSGIVYFIFISAWLNLFLVLEQIKLITYLVGLIVILFGAFMLKDYFHNIICKLCQIDPKKQNNVFIRLEQKLFKKMENLISPKTSLGIMLLGVAGVAAGINLVELVCSFGFPLAFTKALISLSLSGLSYYFYILIYTLFYMLDDFIIFLIAVFTLRLTKASDKYLKIIKLVSAVVLLILGIIMLFKPSILMAV